MFDSVLHKRLLIELKPHGMQDQVCLWVESWLTNRKQQVVISEDDSDWLQVTSGVPQGSALDPFLFLIYMNDTDFGVSSKISKFAMIQN